MIVIFIKRRTASFLLYLDCLFRVLASDSIEVNQILGSDAFGFNSALAIVDTLSRIFSCDEIPILMIFTLIFDLICISIDCYLAMLRKLIKAIFSVQSYRIYL
jgi:hypothetical protein